MHYSYFFFTEKPLNTASRMRCSQYIKSLYGRSMLIKGVVLVLVQVNLDKMFQIFPVPVISNDWVEVRLKTMQKCLFGHFRWESPAAHFILNQAGFFRLVISNDFKEVSSCSYTQLLRKCQEILRVFLKLENFLEPYYQSWCFQWLTTF